MSAIPTETWSSCATTGEAAPRPERLGDVAVLVEHLLRKLLRRDHGGSLVGVELVREVRGLVVTQPGPSRSSRRGAALVRSGEIESREIEDEGDRFADLREHR